MKYLVLCIVLFILWGCQSTPAATDPPPTMASTDLSPTQANEPEAPTLTPAESVATMTPVLLAPANVLQTPREVMLRVIDQLYNQGNVQPLLDQFAPDYVRHPGENDRNHVIGSALALQAAMPDLHAAVNVLIAQDNWIALHLELTGTFTNELIFTNSPPIPPNSQPVRLAVNSIYRLDQSGLVLEEWNGFDNLNFLGQIGLLPAYNVPQQGVPVQQSLTVGGGQPLSLVHSYFQLLSQGRLSELSGSANDDFIATNPFGALNFPGVVNDWELLRAALPDLNLTVDQAIAENNWAAARVTLYGTFTNDYQLADGSVIPATNSTMQLLLVSFFAVDEQGKLKEVWELYDSWDFLTQLGLVLPPVPEGR